MKYLILLLLLSIGFISCDSGNPMNCYRSVKKKYPDCKIYQTPFSFRFIVETDSTLRDVRCVNLTNDDISFDEPLISLN